MTGTPANVAASMAGRPSLRAGDLDEQVRLAGLGVQALGLGDGRLRVVGEQRRHLERHEAVDAGGALVDRQEQIGGARQVLDRQLEEQRLVAQALAHAASRSPRRTRSPSPIGLLEDRRVGGEAGDRQLGDHLGEPPAVEHVAGDVVDPQALAGVVQLLCRLHGVLSNHRLGRRPVALKRSACRCRLSSGCGRQIEAQIAAHSISGLNSRR